MKKITLMDIMESLNGDDLDTANAALHEWFVDQARTVHAGLTGEPAVEEATIVESEMDEFLETAEQVCMTDATTMSEDSLDMEMADGTDGVFSWIRVDAIPADAEIPADIAAKLVQLSGAGSFGDFEAHGFNEGDNGVCIAYAGYTYMGSMPHDDSEDDMDESRVDELSRDTMMSYAKKARKDRDSAEDDEVVGRRVAGLDMVADKARREKTKPQYESEESDEESLEEAVEESEETEEQIEESEDDLIAELNEAFKGLETVSDKLQNQEGAQVGEEGKVPVNTKATLPSHKGKDRIGGEVVEIKSNGHTGHALEKAPKVADVKIKNTVQNGKEEPKKVTPKGDGSALLNKQDGKVNTQSPISGKGAKGLKN